MKGYKKFQELLRRGYGAPQFGFKVGATEINRISARVKLATSFKGMELEGYQQETADAYAALFKTFLMYSAFEQFLEIYGLKFYQLDESLNGYDFERISGEMRAKDKGGKFIDFICEHLETNSLKTRVKTFQENGNHNPAILAAAVRHVFAHGKLTPNANKGNPKVAIAICTLLSDFMLNVMDTEFEASVNRFYEEQEKKGLRQKS